MERSSKERQLLAGGKQGKEQELEEKVEVWLKNLEKKEKIVEHRTKIDN